MSCQSINGWINRSIARTYAHVDKRLEKRSKLSKHTSSINRWHVFPAHSSSSTILSHSMWLRQRFHWKIQWSHVSHASPATETNIEKQLRFEMRGIITSGLDLRRSWTSFGSATALLFPCQSCRVELPGTAKITLEKKNTLKSRDPWNCNGFPTMFFLWSWNS